MRSVRAAPDTARCAGERPGFVEREVGELDAVADVERRPRRVLDQIAGRGDADEHEGETLKHPGRRRDADTETESPRRSRR